MTEGKKSLYNAEHKSGFLTLIGRPNTGKSTLLNAIMEKKIAITSSTVQTTRHRFRAAYTRPGFQLVIVDTPGLHKPHDLLGEELNTAALKALDDVDVVAMLVDASQPVGKGDKWVAQHIQRLKATKIAIISKTDSAEAEEISEQRRAVENLAAWDNIVELSAFTSEGVQDFIDLAVSYLPVGPLWFPEDMETDQPIEVIIAEFIREKILQEFSEEIPHAIGVITEEITYDRKKNMSFITATIFVERESQKGMLIGKKGASIKRIGTLARTDLEHFLEGRIYLDLRVKVKKNWRRDVTKVRQFGYGEGAY